MEIYFNSQKGVYQVFPDFHEDGNPLYEDADILKAAAFVTSRLREEGAKHEKAVIA